jgi:hypothetical protein
MSQEEFLPMQHSEATRARRRRAAGRDQYFEMASEMAHEDMAVGNCLSLSATHALLAAKPVKRDEAWVKSGYFSAFLLG